MPLLEGTKGRLKGKIAAFQLLHQGLEGIEGVFKVGQRIGVGAVLGGGGSGPFRRGAVLGKRGPYPGPAPSQSGLAFS